MSLKTRFDAAVLKLPLPRALGQTPITFGMVSWPLIGLAALPEFPVAVRSLSATAGSLLLAATLLKVYQNHLSEEANRYTEPPPSPPAA